MPTVQMPSKENEIKVEGHPDDPKVSVTLPASGRTLTTVAEIEREGLRAAIDASKADGVIPIGEKAPAATPVKSASPFKRAGKTDRRLKLFLWGGPGDGKTFLAHQFPGIASADMEQGTEFVGSLFEFDRKEVYTPEELHALVMWLLTNKHDYSTFVVDPITVYWQALQEKWSEIYMRRNVSGKGHHDEYYELQAKDWLPIKRELRTLFRNLMRLDMNVIVTAHSKVKYAEGGFMQAAGETFDGEKSLPYIFDVVVRLYKDGKRYMAECLKDRSDTLPSEPFEAKYERFRDLFGGAKLARLSVPMTFATPVQVSELYELIQARGNITPRVLRKALSRYDAVNVEDLKTEDAEKILGTLRGSG